LEQAPAGLGERAAWLAEWKWDGIRGQLIRRQSEIFLWSRGEELITGRFPELVEAAGGLPDGVALDGEVLAWGEDGVLPFAALQTRIGRERLSARVLEQAPAVFVAFDLLEEEGQDLRARPLAWRRARLEALLEGLGPRLRASPLVAAASWSELAGLRAEARARRVEGLML
jgi:DNA ligase-1